MANPVSRTARNGFSLVELMVALLFTSLLMAGMATVFKGTLTTFTTSGEKLSSLRRNRMAIDLLYDDLNNAGMYLTDLSTPPPISSTNEAFYILPDPKAQAGKAIPGVTQGADELYFYMDEPLPFEATLDSTKAVTAAVLVSTGDAAASKDYTYTLDCKDPSYATQVKAGQVLLFKDSWEAVYVKTATVSGSKVTVVTSADPSSAISGRGAAGVPSKFQHIVPAGGNLGCGIVLVKPAQMVRYSIQPMNLDPRSTTSATLCLVRDQGAYDGTQFVADATQQQIITENVSGFRAFISANSGIDWVGGSAYADWAAIKKGLDTQLGTSGRPGFTSTGNDLNWFRSIPLLIKVDVTTRTATQREEYANTPKTLAYKDAVRSFVMVPRHFGLTMK